MVDAEQTYFQPAIRHLTLDLMRQFNKTSPLVLNTYQCYLKVLVQVVNTCDILYCGLLFIHDLIMCI